MTGGIPTVSIQVVAGGEASDDAYAVLEVRAPKGAALPPHTLREDGALLVLAGELDVVLGGERRVLGAGELLALPRSAPRRVSVLTDVRLLVLCAPAGVERLADVLAEPGVDPDDLAALLAAAGVALLPAGWGATAR